jgi:hypothetical protein
MGSILPLVLIEEFELVGVSDPHFRLAVLAPVAANRFEPGSFSEEAMPAIGTFKSESRLT